jgi:hypothetical protein
MENCKIGKPSFKGQHSYLNLHKATSGVHDACQSDSLGISQPIHHLHVKKSISLMCNVKMAGWSP